MSTSAHDCKFVKATSTEKNPYHYIGSGLPNVYLVGVRYESCSGCDSQSAEIPSLNELLQVIARVLVKKECPLTGEEVRFLRKRLRLPAKQFAEILSCSDTHYSRFENDKAAIPGNVDKLVRLIYAAVAKDPQLANQAESIGLATWNAAFDHKECIVATRDENEHWQVIKKAA